MAKTKPYHYEKDPHAIEVESFRQIRALTNLSALTADEAQVAMRLIHTCGDPSLIDDIFLSEHAVSSGLKAAVNKSLVLCDVEMVKQGLTRRFQESQVLCFLNDERVPELAKAKGETRSMAALELWQPHLKDSVVIIGNAPTALFRLLEMIAAGADKPALIIGMPVGFVGAAESKEALIEATDTMNLNVMSLKGRRGGSALSASAWNACLRLSRGVRF
ncbi:precorrin-8X methylmutase [Alkalimarinus sediminis]|uniref:Precorrin-8X methylmutase n=1 Tax=Alkalimarinus sediminis TaxID=1632866 RepID=A0A9E8KPR1_9ALTE|nr:precorrin-8X methylmutase [Alkalimarinus sediminis]UZW74989.1 precorrin-8X methylmutase [Alkalimarinus sediminis]